MRSKTGPRRTLLAALLASVALVLMLPAGSLSATPKPHASTGSATHLRGSSALLTGTVFPEGAETSYYFQYGTTATYGLQTASASAGNSAGKVPVGQPVSGLVPGTVYHFRIVALVAGKPEPLVGHDAAFTAGGNASTHLLFSMTKPSGPNVYGRSFLISGTLSGVGSANAPVELQASPYPYLEPFVSIGATGTTNAAGAFSFRVRNLATNTQFRVVTTGRLPVYSPVVTEQVALSVTLHAAATRRTGFVRLYGTVTPAAVGKQIVFQLEKAIRPTGNSENSTRFVTEFVSKVKRGGQTFSRFSEVVEIRHAGRYRAFIKLPKGPIDSGTSNSVTIRNTAPAGKHGKRKH
jgi:hypothetical protein